MVSRHSAFYSPLIATIAGGFLDKEGLSGSYAVVPKGSGTPAEVAAGRVDVGQAAVASSWGPLDRGEEPPVVHFAQINRCDGFFVAARQADSAFSWDKLRGARFLYVHGGQPEIMLRYGLHKMGVDLSDVPGISKPTTPEMMDAFRGGEGDYFHEQGAYPQQLAHEGVAHVVASVGEAVGPIAFSSLVARRDWLATDDARRFTAAYTAARRWVHTADRRRWRGRRPSSFRTWRWKRSRKRSVPTSGSRHGPATSRLSRHSTKPPSMPSSTAAAAARATRTSGWSWRRRPSDARPPRDLP